MKLRKMLLTGFIVMTIPAFSVYAGEVSQTPAGSTAEEAAGTDSSAGLIAGLFSEDGPLKDVLPEGTDLNGLVSELLSEDGPLKDVLPEGTDLNGLVAGLLSEGGPLKDVLPDGAEISGMLETAREQLGEAGSEISEVLGKVAGAVKDKAGEIDVDAIKEYAGALIGRIIGDQDYDIGSIDEIVEVYNLIRKAEEDFILDHNAGMFDASDVQIVSNNNIYMDQFDVDPIRSLACMSQNNYRLDEENRLWFVSGAADVVLFSHQNNGDGNYQVVASAFAQDGENYMPSIEAMCNEVGISLDECIETIESAKAMEIFDLQRYMKDHPELAGIEFEGEIRTADELETLFYSRLAEMTPDEEEPAVE